MEVFAFKIGSDEVGTRGRAADATLEGNHFRDMRCRGPGPPAPPLDVSVCPFLLSPLSFPSFVPHPSPPPVLFCSLALTHLCHFAAGSSAPLLSSFPEHRALESQLGVTPTMLGTFAMGSLPPNRTPHSRGHAMLGSDTHSHTDTQTHRHIASGHDASPCAVRS
eukprot:738779-Rhodomonas_salina.1